MVELRAVPAPPPPRPPRSPSGPGPSRAPAPAAAVLETRALGVRLEAARSTSRDLIRDVELAVAPGEVLAVVGPSGVGKSTLLRCMNRLIDLVPELEVRGEVRFAGRSIRDPAVEPDDLRARVGMLFQQPVVFPRSILANALFGARRLRRLRRTEGRALAERVLRQAGLWDEVADRLDEPANGLSVGQQQRLCLARALAVGPEVLLMDEPTSALDVRATAVIERLIGELRESLAIVVVTHDLAQARRIADRVARFATVDGAGTVVALGAPEDMIDEEERA